MANIIKKFLKDFDDISNYYNFLVDKTRRHEYVEITNEWIIDNFYILVEHKNKIINSKKKLKKQQKKLNEFYYIIKNIVVKKNFNISFKYVVDELKAYQKENKRNLTYMEIESIIPVLVFVYAERLNSLCREEYRRLVDKEDVELIVREKKNHLTLESFISDSFDLYRNKNYIFEVNNQLSRIKNNGEIFKSLNEYLNNNNISLKDLVNEAYQNKINNNVLVSNIFNNLIDIRDFKTEELFEKISKTEKLLLTDEIYKSMTLESKKSYRKRILKLAKRHHTDEYSYLESIFSKDEHIGFKLFKEKNSTLRIIIYLHILLLLTGISAYFLSAFFIKL